jgi:hypothetical protein
LKASNEVQGGRMATKAKKKAPAKKKAGGKKKK